MSLIEAQEVPTRGEIVVDNVQHFVQQLEERTGYLKFGVTLISDSNPRNLAAQKEFAIGDLRVTPTEAPKKLYGLRYSARAWMPRRGRIRETLRSSGCRPAGGRFIRSMVPASRSGSGTSF